MVKTTVYTKAVYDEDDIMHRHEVVPIAMGARPEDYERQAPYRSYIHVDQFSGGGQEGKEKEEHLCPARSGLINRRLVCSFSRFYTLKGDNKPT